MAMTDRKDVRGSGHGDAIHSKVVVDAHTGMQVVFDNWKSAVPVLNWVSM